MKVKIESETGEFFCDVDFNETEVTNLVTYAIADMRDKKNPDVLKLSMPLTEQDVTKLLQYAINGLLAEEIKREEENKK